MNMKIFGENKDVDSASDLADVRLIGDELKLRRMLWNIMENGIKYTPKGGSSRIVIYQQRFRLY